MRIGIAVLLVGLSIPAALQAQKATNPALVSKAKRAILESLKDPASAQFRKVRVAPDTDRKRVCGEVNSKNGYGGFVGFQKFVYFPDDAQSEILDEDFGSPTYVREQAAKFGSCF